MKLLVRIFLLALQKFRKAWNTVSYRRDVLDSEAVSYPGFDMTAGCLPLLRRDLAGAGAGASSGSCIFCLFERRAEAEEGC